MKDRIADSMFQQLLLRPDEYSVLATPNLNGDYLSDACAAQVGGLGLAPGANIGDQAAVFEATHGTAPKYAGQDKVNPGSVILSGAMMFEHLGWTEAARLHRRAVSSGRSRRKTVTYDLERQMPGATLLKCSEFGAGDRRQHARRELIGRTDGWHERRSLSIGAGKSAAPSRTSARSKRLGDVVLFDVVEGLPQGKALDLARAAAPVEGFDAQLKGTNDYADIAGADVCIVTAGMARKPGMSRDDLLGINAKIVSTVADGIKKHAPKAFVIVVSNPLDAMVTLMKRADRLPEAARGRHGGRARLVALPLLPRDGARRLGRRASQAMVLGGHGDDMVPIRSHTTVAASRSGSSSPPTSSTRSRSACARPAARSSVS